MPEPLTPQEEAEIRAALRERYQRAGRGWLTDISRLLDSLKVLREAHNAEADEFNAGFEAYQAGLPEDAPREDPHDVWLCGYAWAAYEDLKRELAVLREENEKLKK